MFVEIKDLSQVYLGFQLKNFPETARHVLHRHLVQPMYVWLRSVINAGHFACRTGNFLVPSGFLLEGFYKQITSVTVREFAENDV